MRLPFRRGLDRTRVERALTDLLAENPGEGVSPRWDEGGDGAIAILFEDGAAIVGPTERGLMRDPHRTRDMDDLLYKVMEHATFIRAMHDELRTRDEHPDADPFHRMMAIHAERLERIRPHWGERRRREHAAAMGR